MATQGGAARKKPALTAAAGQAASRMTIADIAREAKVSVPTVSKVLNGHAEVAPETRRRVQELIAKYGYARRRARSPQRAGLIDLVFAKIDSEWAVEIVSSVVDAAQHERVGTVVTAVHGRGANTRQWLDNLAARRSDGIIMAVTEVSAEYTSQVRSLGLPVILVDPVGNPDPEVPSVGAANWSGAYAATEHLIALGHRRIAHVAGRPGLQCTRARLDGYGSALAAADLPAAPELVLHGDFSHASGERAAARLLALDDPPTAMFAANDQQALGCYRAIRARGLRIPQDVSVVGFDDLPMAQWADPMLTTIRQPVAEMAAMATRMLLRHNETGEFDTPRMELATKLVERGSTAAPRR